MYHVIGEDSFDNLLDGASEVSYFYAGSYEDMEEVRHVCWRIDDYDVHAFVYDEFGNEVEVPNRR